MKINDQVTPDFYRVGNKLYFITYDPLDEDMFYRKLVTPKSKDFAYGNMERKHKVVAWLFLKQCEPCNIGWVPTYYDFAENHPELLI